MIRRNCYRILVSENHRNIRHHQLKKTMPYLVDVKIKSYASIVCDHGECP